MKRQKGRKGDRQTAKRTVVSLSYVILLEEASQRVEGAAE
jgi:hypothetical protein